MKLYNRLKELIGHEVFITTMIKDDDRDAPGGTDLSPANRRLSQQIVS